MPESIGTVFFTWEKPQWYRKPLKRRGFLPRYVAFHEKCGIAIGTIRPRVAERISFDKVAESHRRIEAGGSDGKLVLCPELLP